MVERRVEEGLHTSQMSEESVNVELLEWLKKNWSTIILIAAVAVLAFQGTQWWRQRVEDRRSNAWADLENTQTVPGLLDVAEQYRSIGSIAELAWLNAAEMHYQQILRDEPIQDDLLTDDLAVDEGDDATTTSTDDSETPDENANTGDEAATEGNEQNDEADEDDQPEEPEPVRLTAEDRSELLDKMESMYQNVINSSQDDPAKKLFEIRAAFGMAMVSEMRLDFDTAETWYERAETLTSDSYDKLNIIASARRSSMRDRVEPLTVLSRDEIREIERSREVPELLERPADDPLTDDSETEGASENSDSESDADNDDFDPVTDEPAADDEDAEDGDGG